MKRVRKLHLWIGLLSSLFLFMEGATGLVMMEPWLVGMSRPEEHRFEGAAQGTFNEGGPTEIRSGGAPIVQENRRSARQGAGEFEREGFGAMGIIRGLHVGRIGNVDVSWLVDLVAVALMVLSGTGIYLSVKILRVERKGRLKPQGGSAGT